MDFRGIPWWIWLIPITLLLMATTRMPYGYYTLLRIIVCLFTAVIAVGEWNPQSARRVISVTSGCVALLFNPVVPIFLKRGTWFYIDISVAVLMAAHLIFRRLRTATVRPH